MKFRVAKTSDVRRLMAAQAQTQVQDNVEDYFRKTSLDNFWITIWTLLGFIVYGAEHRMLMETFVMGDKEAAKKVLFKAFLKAAVSLRTSTLWKGFTSFADEEIVKCHHYYDNGGDFCTLLERAIISIKNRDDVALMEHLEALIHLELDDDKVSVFNRGVKAHTWASYSEEYLDDPVEVEAPKFEEMIGDCSRWDGCYREVYPQTLFIEREVYLQLEVGGLPKLSKVMERQLP